MKILLAQVADEIREQKAVHTANTASLTEKAKRVEDLQLEMQGHRYLAVTSERKIEELSKKIEELTKKIEANEWAAALDEYVKECREFLEDRETVGLELMMDDRIISTAQDVHLNELFPEIVYEGPGQDLHLEESCWVEIPDIEKYDPDGFTIHTTREEMIKTEYD